MFWSTWSRQVRNYETQCAQSPLEPARPRAGDEKYGGAFPQRPEGRPSPSLQEIRAQKFIERGGESLPREADAVAECGEPGNRARMLHQINRQPGEVCPLFLEIEQHMRRSGKRFGWRVADRA